MCGPEGNHSAVMGASAGYNLPLKCMKLIMIRVERFRCSFTLEDITLLHCAVCYRRIIPNGRIQGATASPSNITIAFHEHGHSRRQRICEVSSRSMSPTTVTSARSFVKVVAV